MMIPQIPHLAPTRAFPLDTPGTGARTGTASTAFGDIVEFDREHHPQKAPRDEEITPTDPDAGLRPQPGPTPSTAVGDAPPVTDAADHAQMSSTQDDAWLSSVPLPDDVLTDPSGIVVPAATVVPDAASDAIETAAETPPPSRPSSSSQVAGPEIASLPMQLVRSSEAAVQMRAADLALPLAPDVAKTSSAAQILIPPDQSPGAPASAGTQPANDVANAPTSRTATLAEFAGLTAQPVDDGILPALPVPISPLASATTLAAAPQASELSTQSLLVSRTEAPPDTATSPTPDPTTTPSVSDAKAPIDAGRKLSVEATKTATPPSKSAEAAVLLRAADHAAATVGPAAQPIPDGPESRPLPTAEPAPLLLAAGLQTRLPDGMAEPQVLLVAHGGTGLHSPAHQVAVTHALPSAPLPAATVPALVQAVSQNGGETVELVLSPQDLGKLRFEMTQSGDRMRIHLVVERPETLDLLRRHADQLLSEFRQAGFSGATLSFGQGGQGGQQAQSNPAHHPFPATLADQHVPAPRPQPPGGGLDLRL